MPTSDDRLLRDYADAAVKGDAAALEHLLAALKDPLFRLALRTLGNFADAEDATQEILVKVMTALAAFEHRSAITTWAYRIAVNHLRDVAAGRKTSAAVSFDALAAQLEKGIALTPDFRSTPHAPDPALELEAREIGLHCLQGMLLCLDVDQRTAYVLTDVFDFDTATAAQIAGINEAAYRQRLSRARRALEHFMGTQCGLVDDAAPCRCERQAQASRHIRGGRPMALKFARGDVSASQAAVTEARAELVRLQRIALLFRASPAWSAPATMLANVRRLLQGSALLQTKDDTGFDS